LSAKHQTQLTIAPSPSLWVRLGAATRERLSRSSKLRKRFEIAFVLGGVLLAGSAELFSNTAQGVAKTVAETLWFVGLALAFFGGVVLAALEQDADTTLRIAQEAAQEVEEAKLELATLEAELNQASSHAQWLARLYALSIALREIVEQMIAKGKFEGAEAFNAQVGSLLDLLVADKETFFGIHDERWNFAVYGWHENQKELFCAACRRPHVSEAQAEHRKWRSGEGHVGLAFERKREFVEADLADPETAKFFSAPADKLRDYDQERYRSIASIPLMVGNVARGVLVATSDVPGRFKPGADQEVSGRDPVEALRLTAATIAMLTEVAHIHIRTPGDSASEKGVEPGARESR
jgi:GAF domain-containing protein